jgi:hypothetical protein
VLRSTFPPERGLSSEGTNKTFQRLVLLNDDVAKHCEKFSQRYVT